MKCYNMDEPQKKYAHWKKPDTKEHLLEDSVYIKCPWKANKERDKGKLVVA